MKPSVLTPSGSTTSRGPRSAPSAVARRPSILARVLLALITAYRWTATFRQPRCRFHPTCSSFAREAIEVHGALRGTGLALRRVGRCHPWNDGGVDLVPDPRRNP